MIGPLIPYQPPESLGFWGLGSFELVFGVRAQEFAFRVWGLGFRGHGWGGGPCFCPCGELPKPRLLYPIGAYYMSYPRNYPRFQKDPFTDFLLRQEASA